MRYSPVASATISASSAESVGSGPLILRGSGLGSSEKGNDDEACGSLCKTVLWFCKDLWARSLRPPIRQLPHAAALHAMTHPASTLREWPVTKPHHQLGGEQRDADQDYLESDSEAPRICLRRRATRGSDRRRGAHGRSVPTCTESPQGSGS